MHLALDEKDGFVYTFPERKTMFQADRLIAFIHLFYRFFADFADDFAVFDTREFIVQKQFRIVRPERANHVFVDDIGKKKRRQFSAVHEFFARFFHIFGDIFRYRRNFVFRLYRLEVVTPEAFQKMRVLIRNLRFMRFRAVIFRFDNFADKFRDIKDSVKMQALLFGRTFPYADVLPTVPRHEMF